MAEPKLIRLRISQGRYQALVEDLPDGAVIEGWQGARRLGQLSVEPAAGQRGHVATLDLPASVIGQEVAIIEIRLSQGQVVLDRFAICTSEQSESEMRAEIALLRAEIDLLKSAFRRHCHETDAS